MDHLCIAILALRPDAPVLSEHDAAVLQDAHMAHLADLHDAGHLLAAGPLGHDEMRGLLIFNAETEDAKALLTLDPAVEARRFEIIVMPWMVPAGAISFERTRFPRSMSEVT